MERRQFNIINLRYVYTGAFSRPAISVNPWFDGFEFEFDPLHECNSLRFPQRTEMPLATDG